MRRFTLRSWKTAAVLVVAAASVAVWTTGALASSHAATVKLAIMTDCKGAFAFGYDVDIGGAQTAFAQFAHGVTKSHAKPSAGMSGIHVGATPIKIVGYGCGNDTVPVAVWDTVKQVLGDREITHREFAAAMGTSFSGSSMWKRSPSRERLGRVAAVLDDAELELLATNDVLWDEVVSIDADGVEDVYDAEVLLRHNFIANGIAVHNSIEQDADMVILLHREDAYERESPRAGEADFILAKHRNGPTGNFTVAFQGHYSRFVDMAQA